MGAIGVPAFAWFIGRFWSAFEDAWRGVGDLPILVLLAAPVGLLAGTVSRGISGFVAFWVGALVGGFAIASQQSGSGFAGLAALVSVVVLPQSVLPGYLVARAIASASMGRNRATPQRVTATLLAPSLAAIGIVWLIGFVSAAGVRSSRQPSCAPVLANRGLTGRIAFVGDRGLCVADVRSGSVKLAYGSPTEFDETLDSVRWSADGLRLAAIRERRPSNGPITREILLASAAGGESTPVPTPGDIGSVDSLNWAPDGKRLVVAANDLGCSSCATLYDVTLEGNAWQQIQMPSEFIDVRFPSWSPTGDRILVSAATNYDALSSGAQLLILEGDGQLVRRVVTDAHYLAPASWSNDGEHLAFGRHVPRGIDIYVAEIDGATPARLTASADAAENSQSTSHPVWSPDGNLLAVSVYASNELPHSISTLSAGGGPADVLIQGASDFDWTP